MHTLEESLKIFQELADEYGNTVNDIEAAEKFFEDFMGRTQGDVILDFLDADNWDCIRKIEVDKKNGLVWFYWQMLDKDPVVNYMRKMAFPFDYHGLCLKFDNVRFVCDKNNKCFGICVNGFTIREKNVKGFAKSDGWEIKGSNSDESFFSTTVVREKGGIFQHWRFMTTPITSFWIIPRLVGFHAQDSEKFLYLYGLVKCETDLNEAFARIKELDNYSVDRQRRILKSVGDDMRTVAESLFKLILCFYQEDYHFNIKDYDGCQLKDLTNPLKKSIYRSGQPETILCDIARMGNDLAHDTGHPVSKEDVEQLYDDLVYFIRDFETRIDIKDNEVEIEKIDKQAASEYTEKHLEEICFKDDINETVSKTSSKLSFTIKVNIGIFINVFGNKPMHYLCKDGYIRKLHKEEMSQALKLWDRNEVIDLTNKIYKKVEKICQAEGYDTEYSSLGFSLEGVLKKEANPSHLFTEEEIKELMINANDNVNNKLVIDEDGYAHLIQEPKQGILYPVSQETWCAGNMYVGKNSKLTDLHDSYVLSLHSWFCYLQTGRRIYEEIYVTDHDLADILNKKNSTNDFMQICIV